jgi:hypothetical protein
VIAFLQKSRVPQREVGGAGVEKWFLLRLMPALVPLISSDSPAVRAGVGALMGAVAGVIAALVE